MNRNSDPKVQAIRRRHSQNHAGIPVIVVRSSDTLRLRGQDPLYPQKEFAAPESER
jgi:hypothetical protein